MAYTKTTWVNDGVPAINEANLNKMETGIDEAHDAGLVYLAYATGDGASSAGGVQTVPIDTAVYTHASFSPSLSSGEITFGEAGTFLVEFEVTTGKSSTSATRSDSDVWMEDDTSGSFVALTGSYAVNYNREGDETDQGYNSCSVSYVITSGDTNDAVRCRYDLRTGSDDIFSLNDNCRVKITRLL